MCALVCTYLFIYLIRMRESTHWSMITAPNLTRALSFVIACVAWELCEVFAVATGNAHDNANIALSFDQQK